MEEVACICVNVRRCAFMSTSKGIHCVVSAGMCSSVTTKSASNCKIGFDDQNEAEAIY